MNVVLDKLKEKSVISREDISTLLASIGEPGKKREEKLAAIQELNRQNRQGHDISITLDSYGEW